MKLDWVMIANSLTIYRHPPELLSFVQSLHREGVAVINSAVFHSGFLVGPEFFDYRRVDPANPDDAVRLAWRNRFHDLCEEHAVMPATACIQFATSPPGVASLAMNSSRPERIAEDCRAVETPLSDAFWEQAKAGRIIDPTYPYLA